MTKDDFVIICEDFGGVWTFEEERIYEYRKRGEYFRIRYFSQWDLELPTNQEMENGIKNLEKVNYKVDYIISHCCQTSIQKLINTTYKKDTLTDYLQQISEKCEFKKWYFGHYHDNRKINSQYILLYEDIVSLEYESIVSVKLMQAKNKNFVYIF